MTMPERSEKIIGCENLESKVKKHSKMKQGETRGTIMLKKVSPKKLSEEARQVNGAAKQFVTGNITQTSNLINASSLLIVKQLRLKKI